MLMAGRVACIEKKGRSHFKDVGIDIRLRENFKIKA
jgi:hypothetical protein